MPLSFPQPSFSTVTKEIEFFCLIETTTGGSLSGLVPPFKNEAMLRVLSVHSTGGMHWLSADVHKGVIMFFSRIYPVVWESQKKKNDNGDAETWKDLKREFNILPLLKLLSWSFAGLLLYLASLWTTDWQILTSSLGNAKSTSCSLGFPFEQN